MKLDFNWQNMRVPDMGMQMNGGLIKKDFRFLMENIFKIIKKVIYKSLFM